MLAFSAATGAVAFWAFHHLAWPWPVAAIYLHCSFYGFFGGGTGGHELSHKSVFKTRWLNEFFIRVNGFLTWFNYIHFRHSHAKHHQYTTHHEQSPAVSSGCSHEPGRRLVSYRTQPG